MISQHDGKHFQWLVVELEVALRQKGKGRMNFSIMIKCLVLYPIYRLAHDCSVQYEAWARVVSDVEKKASIPSILPK